MTTAALAETPTPQLVISADPVGFGTFTCPTCGTPDNRFTVVFEAGRVDCIETDGGCACDIEAIEDALVEAVRKAQAV
jgi:hypothetical protein